MRWEGGEIAAEDKKSSTIPLITYLKITFFETMKTGSITTYTTHFPFPEHLPLGTHKSWNKCQVCIPVTGSARTHTVVVTMTDNFLIVYNE